MKMIILIEAKKEIMKKLSALAELSEPYGVMEIETASLTEKEEIDYLFESIKQLASSYANLLLVHYSGRKDIPRLLGDELPEMIITLSCNPESPYYVEDMEATFLETLTYI